MLITHLSLLEIVGPNFFERFIYEYCNDDVSVDMLYDGKPVNCYDDFDNMTLYDPELDNRNDFADILLESSTNVNRQDCVTGVPLMMAAQYNSNDVMEVLLHHGADRSMVDTYGQTVLDVAQARNHEEAAQLLEKD